MITPSFILPPLKVEFGSREETEKCLIANGLVQKQAEELAIFFANSNRRPLEVCLLSQDRSFKAVLALFNCVKKNLSA